MRRAMAAALLALALSSCARHTFVLPVAPPGPQAPAASTPAGAVQRLAWYWNHADAAGYPDVLTADYVFVFAPGDSAGNAFRTHPWLRESELQMAQHLFVGGGDQPPASSIQLAINDALVAAPDPRPGCGDVRIHQTIRTNVFLKVTVDRGAPDMTIITGTALFYLVRGDSASIPAELAAKGMRADSTRWWITRWDDETFESQIGVPAGAIRPAPGPLSARSEDVISWGALKAGYLQ